MYEQCVPALLRDIISFIVLRKENKETSMKY